MDCCTYFGILELQLLFQLLFRILLEAYPFPSIEIVVIEPSSRQDSHFENIVEKERSRGFQTEIERGKKTRKVQEWRSWISGKID